MSNALWGLGKVTKLHSGTSNVAVGVVCLIFAAVNYLVVSHAAGYVLNHAHWMARLGEMG